MLIIKPFNGVFWCLLALVAAAVLLIGRAGRGMTEWRRARLLIALCACNIVIFFVYKGFLSVDREFVEISGIDRFNWFNELPLQLCNINMFLIPLGVLWKKRPVLGFSFFIAPLGALMALVFPEQPFCGYSLLTPRVLGFYLTHALLIVCGLSVLALGFYRPNPKDYPGIVSTFLILGLLAHGVNTLMRAAVCPHANYFFTYGADISILNILWRMIPVPFVYELPLVLVLIAYMALVNLCCGAMDRIRLMHGEEEPESAGI